MDLKQKIKQLPTKPGIYLMKDSLGNIIYVGKAKNLKNRVSQYFQKSKGHAPKIIDMIQNIFDFDIIVTDTELEAFLTECKFIKDIKPMYNSQMKNDKRYCYIKLNLNERFPRISVGTETNDKRYKYFGPYTSLNKVEQTVDFIKDYFKVRKCSISTSVKRISGCLNYELGLCLGVCSNPDMENEYNKCIQRVINFLEGNDNKPTDDLLKRMSDAVEKFEFEKAAKYREYIKGVKHILNKQRLIHSSQRDRNIIAVEFIDNSIAKVFFIKGNRMLDIKAISFEYKEKNSISNQLVDLALKLFDNTKTRTIKRLGQKDIDEAQIIYTYLKKKKGSIHSFWIPSSWIKKDTDRLKLGITKLVEKVFLKEG